jgi:hypothetical protein
MSFRAQPAGVGLPHGLSGPLASTRPMRRHPRPEPRSVVQTSGRMRTVSQSHTLFFKVLSYTFRRAPPERCPRRIDAALHTCRPGGDVAVRWCPRHDRRRPDVRSARRRGRRNRGKRSRGHDLARGAAAGRRADRHRRVLSSPESPQRRAGVDIDPSFSRRTGRRRRLQSRGRAVVLERRSRRPLRDDRGAAGQSDRRHDARPRAHHRGRHEAPGHRSRSARRSTPMSCSKIRGRTARS